jgi:hypothetical protein
MNCGIQMKSGYYYVKRKKTYIYRD